jgi:hypothetical protein
MTRITDVLSGSNPAAITLTTISYGAEEENNGNCKLICGSKKKEKKTITPQCIQSIMSLHTLVVKIPAMRPSSMIKLAVVWYCFMMRAASRTDVLVTISATPWCSSRIVFKSGEAIFSLIYHYGNNYQIKKHPRNAVSITKSYEKTGRRGVKCQLNTIGTYEVDIILQVGIGGLRPFRLHSLKSIDKLLG